MSEEGKYLELNWRAVVFINGCRKIILKSSYVESEAHTSIAKEKIIQIIIEKFGTTPTSIVRIMA